MLPRGLKASSRGTSRRNFISPGLVLALVAGASGIAENVSPPSRLSTSWIGLVSGSKSMVPSQVLQQHICQRHVVFLQWHLWRRWHVQPQSKKLQRSTSVCASYTQSKTTPSSIIDRVEGLVANCVTYISNVHIQWDDTLIQASR